MKQLLFLMLAMIAVLSADELRAVDWYSCGAALEELSRYARRAQDSAGEAVRAQSRAEETEEDLRRCRSYRDIYDLRRDNCRLEESESDDASRELERAEDDVTSGLRRLKAAAQQVDSACNVQIFPNLSTPKGAGSAAPAPSAQPNLTLKPAPPPSQVVKLPPGCEKMANIKRIFAGETLFKKCRERFSEGECTRCLG